MKIHRIWSGMADAIDARFDITSCKALCGEEITLTTFVLIKCEGPTSAICQGATSADDINSAKFCDICSLAAFGEHANYTLKSS